MNPELARLICDAFVVLITVLAGCYMVWTAGEEKDND